MNQPYEMKQKENRLTIAPPGAYASGIAARGCKAAARLFFNKLEKRR